MDAQWCASCQVPQRPDVLVMQARQRDKETRVVPEFSRTREGVMSFGLRGRLVCTAIVLGVFWWLLMTAAPFALIWFVIALPLFLRDIWKRTRVK